MKERIDSIRNNPLTLPITILVTSFAAGFTAGFLAGRRRKPEAVVFQIQDRPKVGLELNAEEFEQIKSNFEETKADTTPILARPKPQVIERIVEEENEPEVITKNVFAEPQPQDDWDYDKETALRTPDRPYVLHKDEFYAEENNYAQMTYVYYAGDDIMVDEDEKPVYNYNLILGELLWGHGSGDPKVFYVRNDKRKTEYEVNYDPGLYSVDVLGLEIEENDRVNGLRHGSTPKFRQD